MTILTQLAEHSRGAADVAVVTSAVEVTGPQPAAVPDHELAIDPCDDVLWWCVGVFVALNGAGIAILLVILLLWFTVGLFR